MIDDMSTYWERYGMDPSYSYQYWDILMDSRYMPSPAEVMRYLFAWDMTCLRYSG